MSTSRLTAGQTVVRLLAAQHSELTDALGTRTTAGAVVVAIETDPLVAAPDSESWWDVPVAEVSELASTIRARAAYDADRAQQRSYL